MKKDFDCVEMKRRGAEHVRTLTQNMTREQKLAFWQERTRRLQDRLEAARRKRAS